MNFDIAVELGSNFGTQNNNQKNEYAIKTTFYMFVHIEKYIFNQVVWWKTLKKFKTQLMIMGTCG